MKNMRLIPPATLKFHFLLLLSCCLALFTSSSVNIFDNSFSSLLTNISTTTTKRSGRLNIQPLTDSLSLSTSNVVQTAEDNPFDRGESLDQRLQHTDSSGDVQNPNFPVQCKSINGAYCSYPNIPLIETNSLDNVLAPASANKNSYLLQSGTCPDTYEKRNTYDCLNIAPRAVEVSCCVPSPTERGGALVSKSICDHLSTYNSSEGIVNAIFRTCSGRYFMIIGEYVFEFNENFEIFGGPSHVAWLTAGGVLHGNEVVGAGTQTDCRTAFAKRNGNIILVDIEGGRDTKHIARDVLGLAPYESMVGMYCPREGYCTILTEVAPEMKTAIGLINWYVLAPDLKSSAEQQKRSHTKWLVPVEPKNHLSALYNVTAAEFLEGRKLLLFIDTRLNVYFFESDGSLALYSEVPGGMNPVSLLKLIKQCDGSGGALQAKGNEEQKTIMLYIVQPSTPPPANRHYEPLSTAPIIQHNYENQNHPPASSYSEQLPSYAVSSSSYGIFDDDQHFDANPYETSQILADSSQRPEIGINDKVVDRETYGGEQHPDSTDTYEQGKTQQPNQKFNYSSLYMDQLKQLARLLDKSPVMKLYGDRKPSHTFSQPISHQTTSTTIDFSPVQRDESNRPIEQLFSKTEGNVKKLVRDNNYKPPVLSQILVHDQHQHQLNPLPKPKRKKKKKHMKYFSPAQQEAEQIDAYMHGGPAAVKNVDFPDTAKRYEAKEYDSAYMGKKKKHGKRKIENHHAAFFGSPEDFPSGPVPRPPPVPGDLKLPLGAEIMYGGHHRHRPGFSDPYVWGAWNSPSGFSVFGNAHDGPFQAPGYGGSGFGGGMFSEFGFHDGGPPSFFGGPPGVGFSSRPGMQYGNLARLPRAVTEPSFEKSTFSVGNSEHNTNNGHKAADTKDNSSFEAETESHPNGDHRHAKVPNVEKLYSYEDELQNELRS